MIFLLFACSEYNFNESKPNSAVGVMDTAIPDPETEPIPLFPELTVSHEQVTETGVCNGRDVDITLANIGDDQLEVSALEILGEGWAVMHAPELPFMLEPQENTVLTLNGWDGTAQLQIHSNDPLYPLQDVALYAVADTPPTLTIIDPSFDETIPSSGAVFTGQVFDAEDEVEDLDIEWTSDIDGMFAFSAADENGEISADFLHQTPGEHEITVTVRDSCEQEESVSINLCQQAGYEVENLDISSWHFEGSAYWDNHHSWVELTPPQTNMVGSAFSTAIPVDASNVTIDFLFFIGDGTGADGISLTALDVDRMSGFLGGTGCGIGYGGDASCTAGPALPGWSIEIDTYYNGGVDPTSEDHLAFTFDGDVDNYQAWATLPEMEDTGWHHMVVEIVAPHVYVEIDGVAYIDTDITGGNFQFPAYIGFTAGTGGATNAHKIDSLMVTEMLCPENEE